VWLHFDFDIFVVTCRLDRIYWLLRVHDIYKGSVKKVECIRSLQKFDDDDDDDDDEP
jgi:hypothetical protein